MSRQDDNIVKCAKRLVDKFSASKFSKLNGEYPKSVQVEIERMKNHCADSHSANFDSGWISVDSEPEIGQEVLILIDVGGNIERGKYIGDGEFTGNWCSRRGKGHYYQVTHWMPLPQPPTKKGD